MLNKIISKLNSSKSFKAAIGFTVASLIQKLSTFLTMPIFTRLLTPEQYGMISLYNSWVSFFLIIATFYFWAGVFNNGMMKYEDDREGFISSVQELSTIILIMVFLIYLLFRDILNDFTGLSSVLMALMFVQMFFTPSLNYWMTRQRYELKYKNILVVTCVMSILNPLLGLLLIFFMNDDSIGRIFSIVIVQVIFGMYFYIRQLHKVEKIVKWRYWKYAVMFNLPLLPHYFSQIVLSQIDILMLGKLINLHAAGVYAVAYSIATISLFLVSSINGAYLPWIYEKMKSGNYQDISKNANLITSLVGLVVIILVFISPEVMSIFAPSAYYESLWVIPPITLSIYFVFLYTIFANIEFYFEESKFIALASILAAIVNILFNALLIPKFGIMGAAYSTLLCYILYSFFHGIFMFKILKKNNIPSHIYDLKILIFISLLVVLVCLGSIIVYEVVFIRYCTLFGIIAVILVTLKVTGAFHNSKNVEEDKFE